MADAPAHRLAGRRRAHYKACLNESWDMRIVTRGSDELDTSDPQEYSTEDFYFRLLLGGFAEAAA